MDWAGFGQTVFMTVYTIMLIVVSVYGVHRYGIVFLYYRHRKNTPKVAGKFQDLPRVTVQLPMFNEESVAQRVIDAACAIEYPHHLLQIQVLDDSTDQSAQTARDRVAYWAQRGMLSTGVNMPLIMMNTIMKKNTTNMACCWVLHREEMNSPKFTTENK